MSSENNSRVPRLRFPGFTGEWNMIKLGDIGDTYSGLAGKSKEDFETGDAKFITFMNVLKNVRIDTNILSIVNVGEGEKQNLVKYGDLLFNTSSETPEEVGFCSVYDSESDERVYLNSFCFGYRLRNISEYNPLYIAYYFRSDYGREMMHIIAQGITRFNLSKEHFNKINIPIPSFIEQKKIAECLSEMDKLIAAQGENVDALKEKKKGLMQQLFPQKGETTPRLRFPEMKGEWKEIRFGDVARINRGGSPRPISDYLTDDPRGVNWIKIGDVEADAKYIKHADEKIIPDGISRSREVKSGDFLLSNSMSFGRPYILKINGCIHDGWLVIQDYQKTFDKEFLYYLLSSDSMLKQYKSFAAGSSVLNLNKEIVAMVRLSIPPTLAEQQKIADCLSALDDLIASESAELEALKDHKKGLMQQLFPQPAK